MHQQLWGYRVEEKLYVGVREQKRLNTAGLDKRQKVLLSRIWSSFCERNKYLYNVEYTLQNYVYVSKCVVRPCCGPIEPFLSVRSLQPHLPYLYCPRTFSCRAVLSSWGQQTCWELSFVTWTPGGSNKAGPMRRGSLSPVIWALRPTAPVGISVSPDVLVLPGTLGLLVLQWETCKSRNKGAVQTKHLSQFCKVANKSVLHGSKIIRKICSWILWGFLLFFLYLSQVQCLRGPEMSFDVWFLYEVFNAWAT
jgi:hypothetical protein